MHVLTTGLKVINHILGVAAETKKWQYIAVMAKIRRGKNCTISNPPTLTEGFAPLEKYLAVFCAVPMPFTKTDATKNKANYHFVSNQCELKIV